MDNSTSPEKIYTNETIHDYAFPVQADQTTVTSTDNTSAPGSSTPSSNATIPNQTFPVQPIAVDTLSSTLNTRTKRIIQEFAFAPMGAIQIGDFTPDVSGDIRISPAGIVARNKEGDTTFALDGDSGNGVFAGELRSGSFVTGEVTLLGGYLLGTDNNGIPNIFIGQTPS